jgi:hypothetical protein
MTIPVPPEPLQRDCAERMADAQVTIAQQERMAEATDQMVAAIMAQLFDGAGAKRQADVR